MENSFQEKVDELQREVEKLDKQLSFSHKYSNYIFYIGVGSPFLIFAFLYLTNFKFVQNDENLIDRKKVLRYTLALTFILYIILFFFYKKN